MTGLLQRVESFLNRFGEEVTVAGAPTQSVVRSLSPAEARVYVDTSLVDAAGRPVRGFFVAHEVEADIGDLVEWLGTSQEVIFVREYRISGQALGKSLFTLLD